MGWETYDKDMAEDAKHEYCELCDKPKEYRVNEGIVCTNPDCPSNKTTTEERVCPYCNGNPAEQRMLSDPDDHGNMNRKSCCEHWADDEAARLRAESQTPEIGLTEIAANTVKDIFKLFR